MPQPFFASRVRAQVECPHLDGVNVAFGRVVEGMDVVYAIEDVAVDSNDKPLQPVVITDCGELQPPTPEAEPEALMEPDEPAKRPSYMDGSSSDDEEVITEVDAD